MPTPMRVIPADLTLLAAVVISELDWSWSVMIIAIRTALLRTTLSAKTLDCSRFRAVARLELPPRNGSRSIACTRLLTLL